MVMVYVVWRRRATPFPGLVYLFGAFIFFCGLTHLLGAVTSIHPVYRLEGLVKLLTAAVSWAAVIALVRTAPEALVLRGPAELQAELAKQEATAREREELLRAAEAERLRLQVVLEQLPAGVLIADAATETIVQANPIAQEVLGALAPGDGVANAFRRQAYRPTGEPYADEDRPLLRVLRAGETIRSEELQVLGPDASRLYLSVNAAPIRNPAGEVTAGVSVYQDISPWRHAEAEREASARRLQGTLASLTDCFCALDSEWRITHLNQNAEAFLGRSAEELLGRVVWTEFPEAVGQPLDQEFHRAMVDGVPVQLEMPSVLVPGRSVEVRAFPSPEGLSVFFRDITDRKHAETERERLLAEQERLTGHLRLSIREAHHRIKNNLQAVTDLLSLELNTAAETETRHVLQQTMSRVQSIALVHDLLSHETELDTVDAREVAERLLPMVLEGNLRSPESATLELDFEPVRLPSRSATTLALALNELVSNAAKHALGTSGGRLRAGLREEGGRLQLWVHDDGPGLPPGFDPGASKSVGLRVLRALVRTNLQGTLTLENADGLRAVIDFPLPRLEPDAVRPG